MRTLPEMIVPQVTATSPRCDTRSFVSIIDPTGNTKEIVAFAGGAPD